MRVQVERSDQEKGGCGKDSMIELNGSWVLKHIAPKQAPFRFRVLLVVGFVKELALGRNNGLAHVWERVVNHASIKSCDKGARHGSKEDKGKKSSGQGAVLSDGRVIQLGDFSHSSLRVLDPLGLAKNVDTSKEHCRVQNKGGAEMGSKSVLRNARVGAGFLHELIIETRLDHPPTDKPLQTKKSRDYTNSTSNMGSNLFSENKISGG